MDKQNLLEYVDLMNRYDAEKKLDGTLIFTENDKSLIRYMRKIATENEEARRFLNAINDLTPDERIKAAYEYLSESDEEPEVLDKKSESMLVTKENIKNYKEYISSMSKEDSNKLNYLINNYDKLNIKYINLETLSYIDNNNEEQVLKNNYNEKPSYEEDSLEDKTFVNDALSMVKREEKPVETVKPKTEKKPAKKEQSGYISAIFLFSLTAFTGSILATIATLILSK